MATLVVELTWYLTTKCYTLRHWGVNVFHSIQMPIKKESVIETSKTREKTLFMMRGRNFLGDENVNTLVNITTLTWSRQISIQIRKQSKISWKTWDNEIDGIEHWDFGSVFWLMIFFKLFCRRIELSENLLVIVRKISEGYYVMRH